MPDKRSITDSILERISSHIGGSAETLHRVKFGRGTVGKVALVAIFALGAISLATYHANSDAALIGIGAMVLITVLVLGLIFYIVIARPELAVMEGMELVQYKQITLGAKNVLPPAENAPSIAGSVAATEKEPQESKE